MPVTKRDANYSELGTKRIKFRIARIEANRACAILMIPRSGHLSTNMIELIRDLEPKSGRLISNRINPERKSLS